MGILYIDTGGATTNSGTSDNNAADLSGTGDAVVTGSVVQLTVGTDLSGVSTSGAAQSAIYIADATNTNQKIFWITAKDDVLDQVTVSVAPTGVTASNWAIGGRMVNTPANFESAIRGGDIIQYNNSPASAATAILTARVSGDTTNGSVIVRGKSGTRPVLTCTGSGINVINGITNAISAWHVSNLELVQSHPSSGSAMTPLAGWVVENVKVSDAGTHGISMSNQPMHILQCEISGTIADGINTIANNNNIFGNYIHDVGGDGIEVNTTAFPSGLILFNIIDTATGKGINYATTGPTSFGSSAVILGNTIYGCGDSGLEVADNQTNIALFNNIFQDNGNAAGEFNIEWTAGSAEFVGVHGNNVFYHQGGGGGANLSGLTVNSTEVTTDPLFTNAAAGDFSIGSTSPAKGTGYPGVFLGGSTGYMDMGAVQRQESASGGGLIRHPGMNGGLNG